MIRSIFYLLVSGLIWLGEGFLFSRLLNFSGPETIVAGLMYLSLLCLAITMFLRRAGRPGTRDGDLAQWRLLAAAPMVVVIIGSFVTLPLLLVIAAVNSLI